MYADFIIILGTTIVGFIIIIWIINKKLSQNQKIDPTLLEWIKTTQTAMNTNSLQMTKVLQENSKQLNERLDKAAQVIQDVNKEVGKMNEIGRNMEELQQFLKSPKLRGNIGEQVLNDLIRQTFPKNTFSLQYAFQFQEKKLTRQSKPMQVFYLSTQNFPWKIFKK